MNDRPRPLELGPSDKVAVLLHLYAHSQAEIERREQREHKMFEWAQALLYATFGGVIALASSDRPVPQSGLVMGLALVAVSAPTLFFAFRIRKYARKSLDNAEAARRIEDCLRIHETGVYGSTRPYPDHWAEDLVASRKKRGTHIWYAALTLLMLACVDVAIVAVLGGAAAAP